MQNRLPLRHRMIWAALATFGTLGLFPATRTLLWTHLKIEAIFSGYNAYRDPVAERAFAAGTPGDYPVQLALAVGRAGETPEKSATVTDPLAAPKARNRRIADLTRRFPNNPSVYANLLRYMTQEEVRLYQPVPDTTPAGTQDTTPPPPSPESLTLFLNAAQQGANLDPDNAYFPMMQAIGLFTVHRDAEALDALRASGHCKQWHEYLMDEVEGIDRIQSATYARWDAMQRSRNLYRLLFPQYAQLRAVAREAVQRAAENERTGAPAEGIAIRHALMHSGGLLRAQGNAAISSLVGVAVVNIAIAGPGSKERVKFGSKNPSTPQEREQNRARYYAYLEQNGMPQEAAWARAEIAAGDEAKAILIQGAKNPVFGGLVHVEYAGAWICNLLLFFSAVVILMLGGYAHLAAQPVNRSKMKLSTQRLLFTLMVIGCIGLWQGPAVCNGLLAPWELTTLFDGTSPGDPPLKLVCLALAASLVLPALFVGLLALVSRKQGVPFATGLGRGLRGAAFPMAAALFMLYGISLLPTAYLAARIDRDCAYMVRSEPRHFAEIVGKAWPGDPQP